jgi:Helix-loop-helix DNA-binding domain
MPSREIAVTTLTKETLCGVISNGPHLFMSTKVSHNAREQRRARRINDKIIQLKGFLEVP